MVDFGVALTLLSAKTILYCIFIRKSYLNEVGSFCGKAINFEEKVASNCVLVNIIYILKL